jgi:hypothetical protein
LTEKITEVFPTVIETDAGTVAEAELLESFIANPPAGAAPVRVTVPEDVAPPLRVLGSTLTDNSVAGFTVSVAVWEAVLLP